MHYKPVTISCDWALYFLFLKKKSIVKLCKSWKQKGILMKNDWEESIWVNILSKNTRFDDLSSKSLAWKKKLGDISQKKGRYFTKKGRYLKQKTKKRGLNWLLDWVPVEKFRMIANSSDSCATQWSASFLCYAVLLCTSPKAPLRLVKVL